ncbi:MAG: DPP IV N-terminal domain-containing protein [Bacteroidales bacterium]|nr:DPP IV N-terminal domain-containing protein [Bacteroidales bacterium]
MKRILVLLLAVLVGFSAQGADGAKQRPNYDLASQFSAKRISQMVFSTELSPNWFRDSDKFWYAWKTPAGTQYWIVDPETGSRTQAFDMEKLAMEITAITRDPFDAQHLPIEGLKLKDDKYFRFDIKGTQEVPDTLAQKRAERAKKDGDKAPKGPQKPPMTKKVWHFQYELATGKLSEYKPEEREYPAWASISPDGKTGVFVKNSNLYWMDRENLAKAAKDDKDSTLVEHRLTSDGIRQWGFGVDNYTGDTETDTTRRVMAHGIVWSPDSKHFAAVKTDMRKIKDLWVINALSQPRPTLETYKYQMPGEPGPTEELYVFTMSDGSSKRYQVQAFKDQSFDISTRPRKFRETYDKFRSRVWLGDNDGFYLVRGSRDLHRMDVCRVDLAADSTRTIVSERMNTYIEDRQIHLINGGKQFLWWSERNGWANLYLYNADGTLVRNLTEGAYHVEDILAVNEKEGYVLFSACGVNKDENPYQMHTWRVALAGGPIRQLDMDDMNVEATASDDGRFLVGNCSRVDYAPEAWLIGRDGKRKLLDKADLSLLFAAGYKMPERFKVKAADGVTDLYGAMYKPFDFDSTRVYPIIDYVYPGPQVEANNIAWSKGMVRTDRLAQIGFIVITVGNRGGHPNRSKWYHNYGYGNLRDYGLEDQKYAIQQLAGKYDWIDGGRVGIHGHSGGGFMSTAAILKYPDFFKAAVSCAGNHDNRIYNRWWSETHHGVTEKVEQSDTTFVYHIETNPEIAANLKGHLMLVHGDIDNNVNPANTIRVVNALIRANKRFDLLILPGQRHGFGDMNEYFFWRLADYFSEWLLGDSERSEVDVKELNND